MVIYQDWKANTMYNLLAKHYDGLVKDDAATAKWVTLITETIPNKEMMELACGSGEITLALANKGYHIDASDLSLEMLEEAKAKDTQQLVHFYKMDMQDFYAEKKYDGILCLCDSINYVVEKEQMVSLFSKIAGALKEDGVFLFDMHSLDRLEEFEEEFYEEGIVNGQEYAWSIQRIDDCLHHNFIFFDENANYTQEQHTQRVFDPIWVKEELETHFEVEIRTDFEKEGIQAGEKYFYLCRKRGK